MSKRSALIVSFCLLTAGVHIAASDDPKPAAPSADKGVEVKPDDLEDYVLKGDRFVVNNFSLFETADPSMVVAPMSALTLQATVKDKNKPATHPVYSGYQRPYYLMVVGLDEKKQILWATKLDTSTQQGGVGMLNDQVVVPRGTLKATATLWMRVITHEFPGSPSPP